MEILNLCVMDYATNEVHLHKILKEDYDEDDKILSSLGYNLDEISWMASEDEIYVIYH